MIEIEKRLLPLSVGGIAAGFMAATLFSEAPAPMEQLQDHPEVPVIFYPGANSTYGDLLGIFAPARFDANHTAAQAIVTFYSALLAKQERLGKEFEEVLFDNLWNLYAR
jgi:hypothetical protein